MSYHLIRKYPGQSTKHATCNCIADVNLGQAGLRKVPIVMRVTAAHLQRNIMKSRGGRLAYQALDTILRGSRQDSRTVTRVMSSLSTDSRNFGTSLAAASHFPSQINGAHLRGSDTQERRKILVRPAANHCQARTLRDSLRASFGRSVTVEALDEL